MARIFTNNSDLIHCFLAAEGANYRGSKGAGTADARFPATVGKFEALQNHAPYVKHHAPRGS
jgi:hypothetical protein